MIWKLENYPIFSNAFYSSIHVGSQWFWARLISFLSSLFLSFTCHKQQWIAMSMIIPCRLKRPTWFSIQSQIKLSLNEPFFQMLRISRFGFDRFLIKAPSSCWLCCFRLFPSIHRTLTTFEVIESALTLKKRRTSLMPPGVMGHGHGGPRDDERVLISAVFSRGCGLFFLSWWLILWQLSVFFYLNDGHPSQISWVQAKDKVVSHCMCELHSMVWKYNLIWQLCTFINRS